MDICCYLFPGQGAQYPGMGKDIFDSYTEVRNILECASDACNMNVASLLFDSSEEILQKTDNTQIAITALNLMIAAALGHHGILPDSCAGFSLGEFSAMHTAGILTLEDTFRIVAQRGIFMQDACDRLAEISGGSAPGMAAVVGLSYNEIEAAVSGQIDGIFLANINSVIQTVVSGTSEAIMQTGELLKAAGAKRYIPLKVAGPFHCPLMEDARLRFEELLGSISFCDPQITCYSNVTGKRITNGDDARKLSIRQMVSPVRWTEEEDTICMDGHTRCIEVGPGKVLTGLWKYVKTDIPCHAAGTVRELNELQGVIDVA